MRQNELASFLARNTGPDNFLQYSISPFQRKHALEFASLISASQTDELCSPIAQRYESKHVTVTESGRAALELALSQLRLDQNDEIWIETTTNNFYISGCVTRTIEKFCKWSRQRSERSKALLINHEFGFPVEDIERYRSHGIPIIEDCAFSFLSDNAAGTVGRHADFVVVSFPKFLPVPFGGALYSKEKLSTNGWSEQSRLVSIVNHYAADLAQIRASRLKNYDRLSKVFLAHGLQPTFGVAGYQTPGVFMFDIEAGQDALAGIKHDLNSSGIQSSVFYGRAAYFIPCHHELDEFDVNYLVEKTITTIRKWQ